MINSIFIAMSGMLGHERGLTVISNNVSNINTPGFRGSTVNFRDVFIGGVQTGSQNRQLSDQGTFGGAGVNASRSSLDLRAGDPQQTDGGLDLMLQGQGYFVLQDEAGNVRYTRNGSFTLKDGVLMAEKETFKVMTRNGAGVLVPMNIKALEFSQPSATHEIRFNGVIDTSTGNNEEIIDPVNVLDSLGNSHTLRVVLTRDTTTPPTTPGAEVTWAVAVSEGSQQLATGSLPFSADHRVVPGTSPLRLNLALKDTGAADIAFNFDDVQSLALPGNVSASPDGFGTGTVKTSTFDASGQLKITYSNGQTAVGPKLVLAEIRDEANIVAVGSSLLAYEGAEQVVLREAGDDLKVLGGTLERSNVNLTTEFSELILMQRGYQASSQVVSTANDMLQELLQMKGGR
ncbi:MAG: flagellar hook-basal body complex protein [Rhizobacter sp.]